MLRTWGHGSSPLMECETIYNWATFSGLRIYMEMDIK